MQVESMSAGNEETVLGRNIIRGAGIGALTGSVIGWTYGLYLGSFTALGAFVGVLSLGIGGLVVGGLLAGISSPAEKTGPAPAQRVPPPEAEVPHMGWSSFSPLLDGLPMGLWLLSFICDATYASGSVEPAWKDVAAFSLLGGIVASGIAALFDLMDYVSLRDPKAIRAASAHMELDVITIGVFMASFWLRSGADPYAALPVALSAVGVALLVFSAWLEGRLIAAHEAEAHPHPPAEPGLSDERRAA